MKIILGFLLVFNAVVAVLNLSIDNNANKVAGSMCLLVAIFLAVVLTIEMTS